jgi:hypothetical protein
MVQGSGLLSPAAKTPVAGAAGRAGGWQPGQSLQQQPGGTVSGITGAAAEPDGVLTWTVNAVYSVDSELPLSQVWMRLHGLL